MQHNLAWQDVYYIVNEPLLLICQQTNNSCINCGSPNDGHTVPLQGNIALARNLHTRHSNAQYAELNHSRATVEG